LRLASGLCINRYEALERCVDTRFYIRRLNSVVVTRAKNDFLCELILATHPSNNYLDRIIRAIASLDPFGACSDYRDDEINNAFRELDTGSCKRQVDQKFGATFMFNKIKPRTLGRGHRCKLSINQYIGVGRVFTVKTS